MLAKKGMLKGWHKGTHAHHNMYKYTSNSALVKYNARIVAKGLKQEEGINFNENFSKIDKTTILRMILNMMKSS